MGLIGTLTKVALGYAAARGVDKVSGGKGLSELVNRFQNSSGFSPLAAAGTMQDQAAKLMAQAGPIPAALVADTEQKAGLLLRAMIQAARADGDLDADEEARILGAMGPDPDEDDMTFLRTQLAAPIDPDSLAADTPAEFRPQVYAMALTAIVADSAAEVAFLDRLAAACDLAAPVRAALHLAAGKPLPA